MFSSMRELVLDILLPPPVKSILGLLAYTPSLVQSIPIITLQSAPLAVA